MSQGRNSHQFFSVVVFRRERNETKEAVRLDVNVASEMSMSCCMC